MNEAMMPADATLGDDVAAATADRLALALDAAREAGRIALRWFRAGIAVETKSDGSPVTEADRAVERALRDSIRARFPDDGILGEELGEDGAGDGGWRWILDPIDGTAAFVAGVPLFAVLIAVEHGGEPVVGVLHFPALGETVWASRGGGAWLNGTRARVSPVDSIGAARVLTSELAARAYAAIVPERRAAAERLRSAWQRLASQAALARTWGDAYGYALVATGRAEIMLDPALSLWDAAPVRIVIEEAGGVFTDADGRPDHASGSAVATNRALRPLVARVVNGEEP